MLQLPAFLFQTAIKLFQPAALKNDLAYQLPPAISLGKEPATERGDSLIPKRIWTYWNHEQPDGFVMQCIQSWQRQCPDYDVLLVHPGNLHTYVQADELPEVFHQLHPTKQSDWLRLYLVAHHGGYWLDASTLLTQSLDWMSQKQSKHATFLGFYLEKFTQNRQAPVIESWAFGATAGSAFITAWQKEFHHALITIGTSAYLRNLQERSDWADIRQGIQDTHYLLIHITAQKVLRDSELQEPMVLYKAEDSAYFYHHLLHWKWYFLYPQLCLIARPAAVSPIVKLRGGERRHFTEMQALHGPARPGSLWDQALQ